MSAETTAATTLHRCRIARRISDLLRAGSPTSLLRAAWRVFVRLARATGVAANLARIVEDVRVEWMFR